MCSLQWEKFLKIPEILDCMSDFFKMDVWDMHFKFNPAELQVGP